MVQLCYNAWHPLEILESRMIFTSSINKRDRGLSMSSNLGLWGHGPFKFIFKPDLLWYSQFKPCNYGGPGPVGVLNKPAFFSDEQEWWSEQGVKFEMSDIESIVFMSDSPGARIHPRVVVRRWKKVCELHRGLVLLVDDAHYG